MEYVQPVGAAADAPYVDANPSSGVEGSPVPAAAIEHPMRELVALITDAGIAPSDADLEQVASAVRTLMQKKSSCVSNASGAADAITGSYTPGIVALTNGMTLYVRAGSANATATPTFTPASGTIAAKTIVKGAGAALAAGDIAGGGHWIELQYDQTLDKWVLLNPATGVSVAAVASVQGAFKNLQASATGTNATITVSADEIAVEDASNTYKTLRTISLAINSAAAGANGLDTGALAASTWYSVWAIYNPTTQAAAGLLSLSATAPTMPIGYTMKARIGWIRTDGTGNKYPLSFIQQGRRVQYKVASGSNVTAPPPACVGVQGAWSVTAPTWAAVSVSTLVPTTASKITVSLISSYNNAAQTNLAVAPNNSYSGTRTANSPPLSVTQNGGSSAASDIVTGEFQLESSNIYVQCQTANGSVVVCGWEDNI